MSSTKRLGRPPGTWWVEPLLRYLADNPDASQADAARALGINPSTISVYAGYHPGFAERLAEARRNGRHTGLTQKASTWWVGRLLDYIREHNVSVVRASTAIGISASTVYSRAYYDPEFARKLSEAGSPVGNRAPWINPSTSVTYLNMLRLGHGKEVARRLAGLWSSALARWRRSPQWADVEDSVYKAACGRRGLLMRLRRGRDLKTAADRSGVPLPTVKRWRRSSAEFDALVVESARAGGRSLTPYPRPTCPGARCGTTTGYDYGCREEACRAAKTAPIIAKRKEQQHGHA